MRLDEAISKSSDPLTIFIVKEALFCNVYEESAWRFSEFIKPYKTTRKRVKKLNMDVVSIGFPKSQLDSIQDISVAKGFVVTDEPGWMIIQTTGEPDVPFQDWKLSISTFVDQKSQISGRDVACNVSTSDFPVRDAMGSIVDEIRSYNVADHTPMQCMQFIIDLQNKIKLVRKMPE